MRFLLAGLFCLFLMLPVSGAFAQGYSAFCGQADSTAASQECLKRYLDSAQKRLNKVYKKLTNKLEGENLVSLKDLQATWLRYRDAECMWEAQRSAIAPLKRMNELSCMARITEDRIDLLTIALNDDVDEAAQREYGSFPRWMNVVAKDYPDVYWNYGKRASYDLDCDEEEEFVMQGFTTKEQKIDKMESEEEADIPENLHFGKNAVVAIAQNSPAGRPTVQIFKFPVQDSEGDKSVCSDNLSLGYSKKPKKKEGLDEEGTTPACRAFLQINNKGCKPKVISWTGKDFALEIEETTEENKEEDKK